MDYRELLYETWAPPASPWAAWAKPVLFAHVWMDASADAATSADVSAVPPADGTTAVVVDLPGAASVAVGIELARRGYRPVPLYNAVPGPAGATEAVDVRSIVTALSKTGAQVRQLGLPADAPPAFLLDAGRRAARVPLGPGVFDNRSVSLPTDFPSAGRLMAAGVRQIVFVQTGAVAPQADLAHTLRRWQEAGLTVRRTATGGGSTALVALSVARPGGFRSMWHTLRWVVGLRRSPLGGFGGTLPVPSAG